MKITIKQMKFVGNYLDTPIGSHMIRKGIRFDDLPRELKNELKQSMNKQQKQYPNMFQESVEDYLNGFWGEY